MILSKPSGQAAPTPLRADSKTPVMVQTQDDNGVGKNGLSGNGKQKTKLDLRRANTVAQSTNISSKSSSGGKTGRTRTSSLRRGKENAGVSRQRSLKRSDANENVFEGVQGTAGREGRNFTVGNVGHNGKIYLRPMVQSPQTRNQNTPFSPPQAISPTNPSFRPGLSHFDPENRQSIWSNSQFSDIRPVTPRKGSLDSSTSNRGRLHAPEDRERRHSLSTIDDHQVSSNGKEFRIVIERPDSERPQSQDRPSIPSLEVPIPHYRLGGFSFTTTGTPHLRSSAYTRTSVSDNLPTPTQDRKEHNARAQSEEIVDYVGQHLSFAPSMMASSEGLSGIYPSTPTQNSVFYKLKEPIEPEIFESLTHKMDDASVVRYMRGTKEILAATPARIVTQISSDSFMDYELVSDFFLTFRSYLSLSNLLSLLLARLQWAINRLEDDGRIIRIRVFAALRHWILNYFVDDFVFNRDLRVHFCQRINELYDEVTSQPKTSASDVKILLDLKRCWNGRCSLYWDSPQFVNEGDPHDKVVPGGVAGSRDPALTCPNDMRSSNPVSQAQTNDIAIQETSPTITHHSEKGLYRSNSHGRKLSSASSQQSPLSPTSPKSIPAISCSLPSKAPKCGPASPNPARGPRPVLVTTGRRGSPSAPAPLVTSPVMPIWRRPTHAHKRSGSFSDSVRDDRAPLPSANIEVQGQPIMQAAVPYGESLIRGDVCAPVDPYVTILSPPSPTLELSQLDFQNSVSPTRSDTAPPPRTSGPGVKTFIGSIRRALNHRQSSGNTSPIQGNASFQPFRGRTSTLPANVAFGSETYRDRRAGSGSRSAVRLDVLCDEAARRYHAIVGQKSTKRLGSALVELSPKGQDNRQSSINKGAQEPLHTLGPFSGRISSQMTTGSKSIVIVDDTGLGIPHMSGGLHPGQSVLGIQGDYRSPLSQEVTPSRPNSSQPPQATYTPTTQSLPFHLVQDPPGTSYQRSSSLTRSRSKRKSDSASSKLRKYASYQSGMISHAAHTSIATTTYDGSSQQSAEPPLGRMLRRRPGGDLRKFTNVQDLEAEPRPHSFASGTSRTTSVPESALYMAESPNIRSRPAGEEWRFAGSGPPRHTEHYSLLPTHSSQRMRPSFEAVVRGFTDMTDDEDDGGVESTLLKLEGKWKRPPRSTPRNPTSALGHTEGDTIHRNVTTQQQHGFESAESSASHPRGKQRASASVADAESSVESEDSYCSIPLLERGLSDDSMKSPDPQASHTHFAAQQPLFQRNGFRAPTEKRDSSPSIDMVEETESLRRVPRGSTIPKSPTLPSLNERENIPSDEEEEDGGSEISSELSIDVIDREEAVGKTRDLSSADNSKTAVPSLVHPLAHPPSPPVTLHYPSHGIPSAEPFTFQQEPITPENSPNARTINVAQGASRGSLLHQNASNVLLNSESATANSDHMPFVLACESRVLAEQFTLVEKAALNEIDWRDLVDMRWSHSSEVSLNWADYLLLSPDHKGIDMIVARFNLMVKWAISEIVLTKNVNERAQAITKLIHVAVHAKRLRNYSTMLQITIALSSVDCTRLVKTWELVPDAEKRLLKDMESLIQPTRNFHKLRQEMETTNLQDGCIPFVGLYVQDLTYNSQKPAQIASTREGEPLVNFERYRTAATIVKSLLRLIDASTKYTFEPVDGVIERCLWIAALPDERIVALSRILE